MNNDRMSKKPSGKFTPAPKLPLLDPGIYKATIRDWELHRQFDRTKILIHMDINTAHDLTKLTYFVSTKIDENGLMREPTGTMKLYKFLKNLWPDRSFEEIDLNELLNMKCEVVVDTVRHDSQRQEKPTSKQYSTIREVRPLDTVNIETTEPWEEIEDDQGNDVPF